MKLYLIQHGLAKSKNEDPERPLTDEGISETKRVADLISKTPNVNPKYIFHSGKSRAAQTAKIFAEQLNIGIKVEEVNGISPMDDVTICVNKISNYKDDIMIVGHLPHLAKLTSYLLSGDDTKIFVKFRNSCVLCLENDELLKWTVKWMIVPEIVP